ncbi:hypothetical protein HanRHA438_Chr04g0185851 [Helianthus annuus]|nr:hypothetical protein HanRHA438_Chr04g0185851 [Helianthus annuus]
MLILKKKFKIYFLGLCQNFVGVSHLLFLKRNHGASVIHEGRLCFYCIYKIKNKNIQGSAALYRIFSMLNVRGFGRERSR